MYLIKKIPFLLVFLILTSCGKNNNEPIDAAKTKEDVNKNVAILLQLDQWTEKEGEKYSAELKAEDFSKIVKAREIRIRSTHELREALNKLQQYAAGKENRDILYAHFINKEHSLFTREAFLETLKKIPHTDLAYQDQMMVQMVKQDENPLIRYKLVALMATNKVSRSIPSLLDLYRSEATGPLAQAIIPTIRTFGPLSLYPMLKEIERINQQTDGEKSHIKNLIELSLLTYKKEELQQIQYSEQWMRPLYAHYAVENELYCRYQKMALNITVYLALSTADDAINAALDANHCPANREYLLEGQEILKLL